jgi:hypothetical protein
MIAQEMQQDVFMDIGKNNKTLYPLILGGTTPHQDLNLSIYGLLNKTFIQLNSEK